MVAKLSLLSLSQLQQLAAQSQPEPGSTNGSWTWNPKSSSRPKDEEDDSWEVRAFEEDYTGSAAGSTWPPKSYTCSFCRREFRSAQALGGHMNVHRRDRASRRLHHSLPPRPATSTARAATSSTASALIIPAQELAAINGGLCLLYQLPHPNYQVNAVVVPSANSSVQLTMNTKLSPLSERNANYIEYKESGEEDLDLELRLGTGR